MLVDISVSRKMLHAESRSLLHPRIGHLMTFIAPTQWDTRELIEALGIRKAKMA
jgi:hypothetical protein